MTVKFPLCAILMETVASLHQAKLDLDLKWIPREQNVEADELSNSDSKRFTKDNEVKVELESMKFILLDEMLDLGEDLCELIDNKKEEKKLVPSTGTLKRKRKPETRLRATHPW